MRTITKLSLCLVFLGFCGSMSAQTKTKTTTKTTTTKTTTKKTTTKKVAVKEINVYVCTSSKDKFYHKHSSCGGLNKCSEDIKNIKSPGMLSKYKRQKCKRCHT